MIDDEDQRPATPAKAARAEPVPEVVATCVASYASGDQPDRPTEREAVRAVLDAMRSRAPGRSVEVRIPPYAAAQVIAGPVHRRGTPPAMVQMPADVLLRLAVGETTWSAAVAAGKLRSSGERSDLSNLFPLYR